ncbi:hypothetical protein B0T19DRAFT_356119, partial [Cercophora scortea]
IILRDYKKPIYKASSRAALFAALEGYIKKYKLLYKVSFFYRDIFINNFIINKNNNNPSPPSFLIDLNFAVRGKTGIRAFIAIGAFLGELYLFIYDFKLFFWVLF